ncbi:MAG: QcrA and Rieske domain-containing protein [Nitrososphaerales archaeon]
MNRREFIERLLVVSALGVVSLTGAVELFNKLETGPSQTPSQSISQALTTQSGVSGPSGYIFVTAMNNLAGKSQAYFNHPKYGSSILLYYNGGWRAFSAVCTHAGCTVNFTGSSIFCPCHSGSFSPSNGAVTGGPPPSRLAEYGVQIISNNLYVSTVVIN